MVPKANHLSAWQIVLMRPAHQVQPLAEAINQLGATTILLPMLNITPVAASSEDLTTWIRSIREADWIIVSSQNAVHCASPDLLQALSQTTGKVVTMGQATTRALMANGVSVFFTPSSGTDSEKLLTETFLHPNEIANKKMVLLAGEGGRTMLAQTLAQRRALITWVKVYRQEKSVLALVPRLIEWSSLSNPFCFIVTSQNSLNHFLDNIPLAYHAWLNQQSFIVVSERIAQTAKKWGIQHIFVAKSAEEEQLCAALLHMTQFCHTMT